MCVVVCVFVFCSRWCYCEMLVRSCLYSSIFVCFFKQKPAYEMRISDWSSDGCSSDLMLGRGVLDLGEHPGDPRERRAVQHAAGSGGEQRRRREIGRASCRERVCPYV